MTKNKKKILLLGLANSGKTSIALSMQNITDLVSYTALQPTRGLEISEFENDDTEFFIWDFGGQEKYREQYKQKLNKYIAETSEIIYVIDIQDDNVFFISVVFLREILNILKTAGFKFELSIYFHKFDDNFKPDEEKIKDLLKIIKEEIPEGFTYKIYHTKIHALFEKNLSPYTI
ncbi:MAG: ADP-ribosylation factor-like protein [Promethearchaeota archaeon]